LGESIGATGRRAVMADLLYLGMVLAFCVLSGLLIKLCDRL
jgi:hypothetical protein